MAEDLFTVCISWAACGRSTSQSKAQTSCYGITTLLTLLTTRTQQDAVIKASVDTGLGLYGFRRTLSTGVAYAESAGRLMKAHSSLAQKAHALSLTRVHAIKHPCRRCHADISSVKAHFSRRIWPVRCNCQIQVESLTLDLETSSAYVAPDWLKTPG
jgi:hypothetical protein